MGTNMTIRSLDDIFFLDPSAEATFATIPLGINIEPSSERGFYIPAEYGFVYHPKKKVVTERNFDPRFFQNLDLFSRQAGYGWIARWFLAGQIHKVVGRTFTAEYIEEQYCSFNDRLSRDILPDRANVIRLAKYR